MLKLRPYQEEAIAAALTEWKTGTADRLVIQLPTGLGKTVIFADMAHSEWKNDKRTLVLVHRDELIRQTARKIHSIDPEIKVGVIKAARREVGADVVVASIQTLGRKNRREEIDPSAFDLIIVDECHHAAAQSYQDVIRYFGGFDGTRVLGLTATLSRTDKKGLGDVWQKVVYKKDILFGIRNGYLVDVIGKAVVVDDLDLGGVKKSGGDYADGALGDAMLEADAGAVVGQALTELAADRKTIIFCPTIAAAQDMADSVTLAGFKVEVVIGSTPAEERQEIYTRLRNGDTQVLVNVGVLTEGFDEPSIDCVVIARPTQSQGLYVQMVGRGLRLHPGKKDCLVLDIVGASANKLAGISDLSESKIVVSDGESLRDAADRSESAPKGGLRDGDKISIKDVDLFAASSRAWLRTPGGHWFIPAGEESVVLLPEFDDEATFMIGTVNTKRRAAGKRLMDGVTLDYGMAHAESFALDLDPSIASRDASWRKRKAPATAAQIDYAKKLGIVAPEAMSKRDLSDAISITLVGRMVDGYRPGKRPVADYNLKGK